VHSAELEMRFIRALTAEIELRTSGQDWIRLGTLYIGGGTPTVLSEESWRMFFDVLHCNLDVEPECEITVEANPESTTRSLLKTLRELGVNRVSLGAQSFRDHDLKVLWRIHSAAEIARSVDVIRNAGIENLSLDLIYGLPDEGTESLLGNLRAAVDLQPEHLSIYALTLENDVPLQNQVESGHLTLPDDDQTAADYLRTIDFLEEHGLQQYEVSNFSRPDSQCRHNLNYWHQGDYLAFGPSAVSTFAGVRTRNLPDLVGYVDNLQRGELPPCEVETLNDQKLLLETIMLSLRLNTGLDTRSLKSRYGYDILSEKRELISALSERGDLRLDDNQLLLTPEGMLRLTMISEALSPDII
jgi:oxygen-independent coproporphyrinogen-3 oxidase